MLLSATPHDGSARSFASLMSLLDPTAISDPEDYTPDDFEQGPRRSPLQERHSRSGQRRFPGTYHRAVETECQPAGRSGLPGIAGHPLHPEAASTTPASQPSCSGWACRKACSPARPPRSIPPGGESLCCRTSPPSAADEQAEVAALEEFRCRPAPDRCREFQQVPAPGAASQRGSFNWQAADPLRPSGHLLRADRNAALVAGKACPGRLA
jgi:hypothetical protein